MQIPEPNVGRETSSAYFADRRLPKFFGIFIESTGRECLDLDDILEQMLEFGLLFATDCPKTNQFVMDLIVVQA